MEAQALKGSKFKAALRRNALSLTNSRVTKSLDLQAFPVPLRNAERISLPFERFQKLGIVIRLPFHAFPGEDCVVSRTQAAQLESSALIADRLAVAVDARSQARFRNCHNHGIGDWFAFAINHNALSHAA